MAEYHSGRRSWTFFEPNARSVNALRASHSYYRIQRKEMAKIGRSYLIGTKHLELATSYQITQEPMPDYLLLSGNARLETGSAAPVVKGMVIIDGTVPFSNLRKIRKYCDSLLIPVYVVREKGAFIIEL